MKYELGVCLFGGGHGRHNFEESTQAINDQHVGVCFWEWLITLLAGSDSIGKLSTRNREALEARGLLSVFDSKHVPLHTIAVLSFQ